jgi:hypothetical protein
MRFLIITTDLEHFDEDAFGPDGHGHASKSKEILYLVFGVLIILLNLIFQIKVINFIQVLSHLFLDRNQI